MQQRVALLSSANFLSRCRPADNDTGEFLAEAVDFFGVDFVDDFASNFLADIKLAWREIIYMCLVALGMEGPDRQYEPFSRKFSSVCQF